MPRLNEARRLRGLELSQIRQVIQAAPPDAINLALGELGFPLPGSLRHHALKLLQTATPVYTPNAGLPRLRESITRQYPGSDPGNICVCNGVEEALFVSLLSLLDPGDTVAIPDPDYPAYASIVKILECNVLRLPYESNLSSVDWDLWASLLDKDVKTLVLSHPGNPAGHIFDRDELERLAEFCNRHGITLLVDEIYYRLAFEGMPPSFNGKVEHLFQLGGLSKSHCMSGWRVGWVLSPPELAAAVVKARQYVSTCSNWLSQQLAVFALSEEGLAASREVLEQLKACRDLALNKLEPWTQKFFSASATPYLMMMCPPDALSISRSLAARGVICVPGNAFGRVAAGWLRINIAVALDKLETALDRIIDELYLH